MITTQTQVKFFDYPLQFSIHKADYEKIILDVLSRGAFILGSETKSFEENLAKFVGTKHAIGVGNCTDGLLLSLMAAGVKPGDEVISVSHTFVATIEVIKFLGATPVLIDIADDHTMNIDLVEAAITSKTKVIMPVQLNGHICSNMEKLVELARKRGITIIEDSAQSLGATYMGKGAGTFGLAGNFSFYPAKLLGTFGDAGAIVTNDSAFAEKVWKLRNHGRGHGTAIETWGLNCRMDNVHAAILDYKLKLLPSWIERRREIAKMYHEGFSSIDAIDLPMGPDENPKHHDVFQNYEIEVDRRDALINHLKNNGIESPIQWGGKAVHQFPGLDLRHVKLPRTEKLFERSLLLPLYPELENSKVQYVIETVKAFYQGQ